MDESKTRRDGKLGRHRHSVTVLESEEMRIYQHILSHPTAVLEVPLNNMATIVTKKGRNEL